MAMKPTVYLETSVISKKKTAWQEDEIMQALHRVREKLGKQLTKDPEEFYKRMDQHAKEAGLKFSRPGSQQVPRKKNTSKLKGWEFLRVAFMSFSQIVAEVILVASNWFMAVTTSLEIFLLNPFAQTSK